MTRLKGSEHKKESTADVVPRSLRYSHLLPGALLLVSGFSARRGAGAATIAPNRPGPARPVIPAGV